MGLADGMAWEKEHGVASRMVSSAPNPQQLKADAGKARPDLLQVGMARALRMVQATMEYGAIKYEAHSWRNVDDGIARYLAAAERHRQDRMLENTGGNHNVLGPADAESGLPHIAHEVFCLLAIMELAYAKYPRKLGQFTDFNQPPQDHKGTNETVPEPGDFTYHGYRK